MTTHIYTEVDITPVTKSIRVRGHLDSSGPRFAAFSYQTTTADAGAGAVTMRFRWEDAKSQIRVVEAVPITLTAIDEPSGGIRSVDAFMVTDQYFGPSTPGTGLPSGSGGDDSALGLFVIEFDLGGSAGTSLFSYQALIEVNDGSPAIIYHP